jgi:hypothetical protein
MLHDQTVHGTQVFDKESTLTGTVMVESTALFTPWKGESKVFYKIRADAIAPRHFRESADHRTIAVRYVVTNVSPDGTRLGIDAVLVETSHRAVHPSDGTVESSESKVIQERLQAIQFAQQEAADAQRRRESLELETGRFSGDSLGQARERRLDLHSPQAQSTLWQKTERQIDRSNFSAIKCPSRHTPSRMAAYRPRATPSPSY